MCIKRMMCIECIENDSSMRNFESKSVEYSSKYKKKISKHDPMNKIRINAIIYITNSFDVLNIKYRKTYTYQIIHSVGHLK